MFGKLFQTAEQRRDQEVRQVYDSLLERVAERKRSFRREAAEAYAAKYPGCSMLISPFDDNFLVLAARERIIVKGKFIDRYIKRPEYVPQDASTATRLQAIRSYEQDTQGYGGDVRVVRELSPGDEWFFPDAWERKVHRVRDQYVAGEWRANELLFVAVRRNNQPICSVNAFSPKPHLYFQSYLPGILLGFDGSAANFTSVLSVDLVFPGMSALVMKFEQTYDDFHKRGISSHEFISMLDMWVKFLNVAEQMTHDTAARIAADADPEFGEDTFYKDSVVRAIPDIDTVPGWVR